MDKKITLELAALYSRHASLVNLMRSLEEYAEHAPALRPAVCVARPKRPTRRIA